MESAVFNMHSKLGMRFIFDDYDRGKSLKICGSITCQQIKEFNLWILRLFVIYELVFVLCVKYLKFHYYKKNHNELCITLKHIIISQAIIDILFLIYFNFCWKNIIYNHLLNRNKLLYPFFMLLLLLFSDILITFNNFKSDWIFLFQMICDFVSYLIILLFIPIFTKQLKYYKNDINKNWLKYTFKNKLILFIDIIICIFLLYIIFSIFVYMIYSDWNIEKIVKDELKSQIFNIMMENFLIFEWIHQFLDYVLFEKDKNDENYENDENDYNIHLDILHKHISNQESDIFINFLISNNYDTDSIIEDIDIYSESNISNVLNKNNFNKLINYINNEKKYFKNNIFQCKYLGYFLIFSIFQSICIGLRIKYNNYFLYNFHFNKIKFHKPSFMYAFICIIQIIVTFLILLKIIYTIFNDNKYCKIFKNNFCKLTFALILWILLLILQIAYANFTNLWFFIQFFINLFIYPIFFIFILIALHAFYNRKNKNIYKQIFLLYFPGCIFSINCGIFIYYGVIQDINYIKLFNSNSKHLIFMMIVIENTLLLEGLHLVFPTFIYILSQITQKILLKISHTIQFVYYFVCYLD